MKNLPTDIWILIYQFEGLFYEYIKDVKQELDILSCKCICRKNGEGYYSIKFKKYYGVCPIHWDIWKYSIKLLKKKQIPSVTLLENGIWSWNDIYIPNWVFKLKKKKSKIKY